MADSRQANKSWADQKFDSIVFDIVRCINDWYENAGQDETTATIVEYGPEEFVNNFVTKKYLKKVRDLGICCYITEHLSDIVNSVCDSLIEGVSVEEVVDKVRTDKDIEAEDGQEEAEPDEEPGEAGNHKKQAAANIDKFARG